VLVTHHVEEIVPVFTHALLLRSGRAVAAGSKADVLSSRLVSRTFDASVRLHASHGRYSLSVAPKRGVVI